MTLAGAGRPEEERILVGGDEAAGGESEDEGAIELLVEVEVEGVEGLVHVVVGQTVGAGHFHQLEVPDQVNGMIDRFLAISKLRQAA